MQGDLEQQLAAIARQYADGQSVDIEIPLLRIHGKVHPCGVLFQLDCSPVPEPQRDADFDRSKTLGTELNPAEKRRWVQVAKRSGIDCEPGGQS